MKKCLLSNCEFQLEGYCAAEDMTDGFFLPRECKAKKDSDLLTEEEYQENINKPRKRVRCEG